MDTVSALGLGIAKMTVRAKLRPDTQNPGTWLPNRAAAKTGLNKSIINEGWGDFHRMITYQAAEHGGTAVLPFDGPPLSGAERELRFRRHEMQG